MLKFLTLFATLALAIAGTPAAAQPERIDLPLGKSWTHPHSGIELPFKIGGVGRDGGYAYRDDFLDVGVIYDTPDGKQAITVYIFRNTNGSVPIWFAQAQGSLEARDKFEGFALVSPPAAFVPPGHDETSGLKAIYAAPKGEAPVSTGIAMFAVRGWYLKVRVTSRTRSAQEMAAWMDGILQDVSIPAHDQLSGAVAPVADCDVPLVFTGDAVDATNTMDSAMTRAVMASARFAETKDGESADNPEKFPDARTTWCREEQLNAAIAVYRPVGTQDRYLLAVGDNGRAVSVGPTMALPGIPGMDGKIFEIDDIHADYVGVFAAQTALPTYERTIEVINEGKPVAKAATWGRKRDVQIYSDQLE